MKSCPYCAEPIHAAAMVCRHCSRDLEVSTLTPSPGGARVVGLFLSYAIVALLLVVAAVVLLTGLSSASAL